MIGRARLQLISLMAFGVAAGLATGEIGLRLLGFRFETFPTIQFGWPDPTTIVERYRPDRELFWVPRARPVSRSATPLWPSLRCPSRPPATS